MIKGSCDFKGACKVKGKLMSVSFWPHKFGDNRCYGKWDLFFSICHVTSLHDLFKLSCDSVEGTPHPRLPRC